MQRPRPAARLGQGLGAKRPIDHRGNGRSSTSRRRWKSSGDLLSWVGWGRSTRLDSNQQPPSCKEGRLPIDIRVDLADGGRVERPGPCGLPDFESGSSPIRIPSGKVETARARGPDDSWWRIIVSLRPVAGHRGEKRKCGLFRSAPPLWGGEPPRAETSGLEPERPYRAYRFSKAAPHPAGSFPEMCPIVDRQ